MAESKKLKPFTTPKGTAKFPRLIKPDFEFSEEGRYGVQVIVEPGKCKKTKAYVEKLAKAQYEKKKAELLEAGKKKAAKELNIYVPIVPDIDKEENETGMLAFKCSANAKFKDKNGEYKENTLPIFDASLGKWDREKEIGFGSVIKVSVIPWPFYSAANKEAGVSLRIKGVQIIKWEAPSADDPESMGFTVEDEDFEEGDLESEGEADSSEEESGEDDPEADF